MYIILYILCHFFIYGLPEALVYPKHAVPQIVEFGIFALYRPLQQLNYKYILFYKILSLDVSLGPKRALFMKGMQFLTKNAHLLNFCTIGHIGVI